MTENKQDVIEVDAQPTQAVAVRPEQQVVNPLDLEPSMFKAGLDRRKENRKSLIEWVREALVDGTDFGRIPTKRGPSKPSLWKPGAEKICGMLGVTPTFPNLPEYEKACLAGATIKQIMLRCEIVNSSGGVIAHGVGCRSMEQDYGDMNKCIKMAEKSAHIDATLRMAGLSEIFTQDIEDMPKTAQDGPQPPAGSKVAPPAKPSPQAKPERIPATPTQCLEKFVKNIEEGGLREKATQFCIELGWLMPNEKLEDMPERFVPLTKEHYVAFVTKLTLFAATNKAEKPYEPHPEVIGNIVVGSVTHNLVPKEEDYDSPQAPWRSFPVPFGKHAGVKLADLDKNFLYGFCSNYTVQTEWEDKDGKVHQTKPEKLAKDRLFRQMLDEAGKHYSFEKKEERA